THRGAERVEPPRHYRKRALEIPEQTRQARDERGNEQRRIGGGHERETALRKPPPRFVTTQRPCFAPLVEDDLSVSALRDRLPGRGNHDDAITDAREGFGDP